MWLKHGGSFQSDGSEQVCKDNCLTSYGQDSNAECLHVEDINSNDTCILRTEDIRTEETVPTPDSSSYEWLCVNSEHF